MAWASTCQIIFQPIGSDMFCTIFKYSNRRTCYLIICKFANKMSFFASYKNSNTWLILQFDFSLFFVLFQKDKVIFRTSNGVASLKIVFLRNKQKWIFLAMRYSSIQKEKQLIHSETVSMVDVHWTFIEINNFISTVLSIKMTQIRSMEIRMEQCYGMKSMSWHCNALKNGKTWIIRKVWGKIFIWPSTWFDVNRKS